MRKYSLKKFIFIVTAFAAFFCATGCEIIGLGAAVDANPPSLTITLPAVNAAVSSNFNISGTCDDDTGVREVRIVGLKDTENKVAYGTLFNGEDLGTAELPDGANWNVPLVHVPDGDGYNYILNGHTLNLADGTYIAYLTAFDGNRECMDPMPVSFDIDNTPPVFLVSAPSTVEGSEGGKEYGRSVVISGTIADGHDIEKMYVTAYRADGTVIDLEKTEFDVPDKANVSVIMAKYSATSQEDYDALPSASQSDERALQHNYMKLFGEDGDVFSRSIAEVDTINVSVAVKLLDKAGNMSERVFFSGGLTALARAEAGLANNVTLDSPSYMYILNGNTRHEIPLSAAGREVMKNALLGNASYPSYNYVSYDGETDHKRLILYVNPNNLPTYTLSGGYAVADPSASWKEVYPGSVLSIRLASGRDGDVFNPENFTIRIIKAGAGNAFDANGTVVWECSKNSNSSSFKQGSSSAWSSGETTDGSYSLLLPAASTFRSGAGNNFYLVVDGEDIIHNPFTTAEQGHYGFQVASTGRAPTISCDYSNTYRKLSLLNSSGNSDSTLTVKIDDPEDHLNGSGASDAVEYRVYYFTGHYDSINALPELNQAAATRAATQIAAGDNVLLRKTADTKYEADLAIDGCPSAENNYTVLVLVTAKSDVTSQQYKFMLYADGQKPLVSFENPELGTSGSKKINSNTSGYTTVTLDDGTKEYYYELRGKVSDAGGSGVNIISVNYNDGNTSTGFVPITDTPQVTSETSWMYKLKVKEGENQAISVKVSDISGNESNVMTVSGITMDFEAPTISLASIKKGNSGAEETVTSVDDIEEYYNQKPVTVKLNVSDEIGVDHINVQGFLNGSSNAGGDNTTYTTYRHQDGTNSNSETISIYADGKWKFEVLATDMAGLESKKFSFELTIDSTKPLINNDAVVEGLTAGYTTSDVVKISGTANEQGTGLSRVEYKLTDSTGHTSPDWIPSAATGKGPNATFSVSVGGLTTDGGGKNTIQIRVYDNAGNPSEPKSFEVYYDNESPVITSEYYRKESGTKEGIPSVIYYKGGDASKRTFYGTISDEGGISGVQLYADGTAVSSGVTYTYTTESTIAYDTSSSWVALPANGIVTGWKAELNAPVAGNITVKATDKAGHVSSAQVTKFISDATAPVLTVTNLSDNGSIRETDRNADGSYTLRGTWSDAGSGTYGLEWSLNGTSFTPVSESDAPKTTGTANWAVTIPSGSLTAGTGRTIYLKATDDAGNLAVLNLTGITCDYSDPSISISTSVGAYYPYSASPLDVSVLASDDVGLSGITVVSAKKNGVSVSEGSGSYTFTPSGSGTSMTGTVSIPRNMTADGAWEITVRATDSLNRQKEASFSTTIDGSKPVVDVSGATAEGTLVGTATDKWFKTTTIRVGASATDTGYSGLETIYYKVVEDGTAVSDLTADSSDGQAAVSGNDATFSITASLASSSNWVYLQAVDKAGNKSDMKKVVINVDMDMPSLQSKYYTYNGANFQPATGSIRTNGANDLTVYGNINDSKSGVKEVKFFRTPEGGSTAENFVATMTYSSTAITDESHIPTDYAATISDPKSVRSFKAVISSSKLSTGSVKAEASDIAGNVSSQFVFSLIEDTTPPAIVLKNPGTKKIQVNGVTPAPEDSTNVASLNGTVTISGSASDDALAAVEVFYKVGDASATQYIPCGTFTGSAAYNWSTDELVMSSVSGGSVTMLGTTAGTTVPYTGDTENVYIKVIAHDSADNTTEHIYKYVIDPESDRPVIRLTNVSLTNAMSSTNRISHTSKTIYGNVSDDDGSVSKLEYSYTGADNSWTEVSVTGGSWTLDIDTDGDKEIYFRVTDANGSVFTSTASGTQYTCPKLTAGTGDSGISVLYLNVDTAKPEVSDIGFQTGSTNASWGSTYDDAFATAKFGGPRYRYARFRAKAEDTNGIESVMFKIGNAEVTGNKQGSTNYYTADFDLSTFNTTTSTQSHTLTVSASDVAGGVTELTRTFSIDNDLPVPTGSVPGIVDSATSVNGKINELGTTTYFSVTVDEGTRPADNLILNGTGYAVGGWLPVSGTSTSLTFTIWFDDNPSPSDGLTHTQLFSQYLAELGITPNEETQANEFVNLHLMSIDECGNVGYGSIRIEVDPFGDKPTVSISQPSNGATLGGDIIVAGTAIDTVGTEGNIGVFGVGIKMDVNNDGKWTGADIQDILGRTQNFAWCRYDGTTLVDVDTANLPGSSASEDECRTYAIKADMTGSSSWTFMINDGFTPENADALPIALGAFAVDKDGKTSPIDFSRMSRRSFTIDSAAPKMDGEMLYKRKADGSSDQNNFSEYTEGKSIRKEWVFEADIYDDNGIRRISVDGVDIVSDGNPVTTVSEDVASVGDLDGHSGYSGFHIRIPVGRDDNTSVETITKTIKYWEDKDGAQPTTRNIVINIDNMAPTVIEDGADYKIKDSIENNNGFFTFGSQAMELSVGTTNQTGVSRVAFYITRDVTSGGTSYSRLYDPMIARSAGSAGGNYVDNYSSVYVLDSDDGLRWKAETVAGVTATSVTIGSVNKNVHVGGLAKIHGAIYRIKSVEVSGSQTTLTFGEKDGGAENITGLASNDSIYVALANVVDNTINEGNGSAKRTTDYAYGYWNDPSLDDGDYMVESCLKQGTTWTWEANINSKNIEDGPAVLHYVVFDKAGNSIKKDVNVTIRNNMPRVAGLTFCTDDNANDSYQSSETYAYHNVYDKGYNGTKAVTDVIFPVSEDNTAENPKVTATVRNKISLTPEIVGGNGALSYQMLVYERNDADSGWKTTPTGQSAEGVSLGLTGKTDDSVQTKEIEKSVWDMKDMGIVDGEKQKLTLRVSDETIGATGGLSADFSIVLNFALDDGTAPAIRIKPFYWNSKDDNSLYQHKSTNGHIELTKDLPETEFAGTSGLYDKDPKVSGKIRIEGVAWDNAMLTKINVRLGSATGTGTTIASYNGSWSYPALSGVTDVAVGKATYGEVYDSGIIAGFTIPEGKNRDTLIDYTTQEYGHIVKWSAVIDTATIFGVTAGTDKIIDVFTVDRGSPNSSGSYSNLLPSEGSSDQTGGNDGEGAYTSHYRMDVVPYITGIKTELSAGNKRHPTVLSRSSLGVYPVRRGSNITVEGFNLNGTSSSVIIGSRTYTPTTGTTTNSLVIKTDANTPSDVVTAKTGDVTSLNNETAKSVTTGSGDDTETRIIEYNQEPNGQNNEILTDNRELLIVDVYTTTDKQDKRMLDMAISGNSINFSAGYRDAYFSVMLGASGTSVGSIKNLRNSYTRYFDNAIAINDDGTPFTVSACGDTLGTPVSGWSNGPSQFALRKGINYADSSSYIWEYGYISNNTTLLVLDSNWNGADLNNLDRFKWPDIVVTGNNSATKGYISYYDTTQNLVKFRYFTSNGSEVATNLASYRAGASASRYVEGAANTNATYSQGYVAIAGADENSPYSSVNVTSDGAAVVAWYDATNGALKMKYNTNPAESFSGYQVFGTVPSAGTVTFNLSVDGGAARPVSVTYANPTYGDAEHEFAYQLNLVLSDGYGAYAEVDPKSNNVTVRSMQTGTGSSIAITSLSSGTVNAAVAGTGAAWNKVTIDENSAGQYVAMKTDSKGGIHFAYYDTGNGDLKYAYMASVTDTPKVVTVDGYQQVGQYVDLALKETVVGTKTNVMPYISYYSMSNADTARSAKVARLSSPIVYTGATPDKSVITDGSNDELFTGSWESFHVPTNGKPVQYRINIGVTSAGNVYISYLADRTIEYVKVY